MIILIIIGRSDAGTAFRIARRVAAQGRKVVILFIGEGCRIAENAEYVESLDFARVYALDIDCPDPALGVSLVDYNGWIKLLEYCNKTISWI